MYMSGNEIRRAHSGEIAEIMNLIAKCVQVMQAGGSDQWNESYPNREVILEDIRQGTLFVCTDHGVIAGIIVLDDHQSEQYQQVDWVETQGPNLIMHRLAVHPEIQGKGIARRLIAFAEEFARSGGFRSIRLDTYAKNGRALKLYQSMGYSQRGELRSPNHTAAFPVFEKVLADDAEN